MYRPAAPLEDITPLLFILTYVNNPTGSRRSAHSCLCEYFRIHVRALAHAYVCTVVSLVCGEELDAPYMFMRAHTRTQPIRVLRGGHPCIVAARFADIFGSLRWPLATVFVLRFDSDGFEQKEDRGRRQRLESEALVN